MIKLSALLLLVTLPLTYCSKTDKPVFKYQSDDSLKNLLLEKHSYPAAKIIVFTDPHFFPESLGVNSSLFYDSLDSDKKFMVNGQQVINYAIDEMSQLSADFIVLSGDMTKDGEYASHVEFAKYLKVLEDSGKPVFVIPGNHDIQNGLAMDYSGDAPKTTDSVTTDDFIRIYSDFGYKESLYTDDDSLSYVAEPVKGLWLLCLDSNSWRENEKDKYSVTAGKFYPETLQWIEEILIESKRQKKAVMVSMHHAVLEHFKGQNKFYSNFVVENFDDISRLFAAYGVSVVFSGHYHAQDIVEKSFPEFNHTLYDIETGSFVSYPLPYRQLVITPDQKLIVKTILMKKPQFDGMILPSTAKKNITI